MSSSEITVMIVDDQEITRLGLKLTLEKFSDFKVVAEASDGQMSLEMAREHSPQVVLMDIGLPGIDGIEAARQIQSAMFQIRIMMLTARDHDDDVFAALAAGVHGYCLKERKANEIATAIRTIVTGAVWLDPAIAKRVLQNVSSPAPSGGKDVSKQENKDGFALSVRELEVLQLIVEGLTNSEIGQRLFLSVDTVKTHVRHIMEKLAVSDRTQAAVKALRHGFV